MKSLLILSIAFISILQSCKVGTSGTQKDENIDPNIKSEIQILDSKIIEAVTSNNPTLIKSLMSEKLLEVSGNEIDEMIKQVSSVITSKDYRVLNQFHVHNSTTGIGNTVISGINGGNDYTIHYQALNKEMFISLIIPKDKLDEILITNIYGKYPDGWKLNILQFGQYKINGQTAIELFTKANNEQVNGFLVDAANNMFLSSKILKPAGNIWQYQKEEEMKKFFDELMAVIKREYVFPLTIKEIETKPQILNIYPMGMQEGYFPAIEYLTKIDLKDTTRTKIENDKIHEVIGNVFKGIDKENKNILYKAYNEIPNGKTPVPTYGFVKENKQ